MKGQIAPNFTLPDENGNSVELKSYMGKKLFLVFYPGDNTAVCTKQLCSYSSGFDDFKNSSVEILAISMDSIESHKKFKEKFKLAFPLLADIDGKVCDLYKAKGLFGVKRSIFLLDENQKIIYEDEVLPVFYKDKDDLVGVLKNLN